MCLETEDTLVEADADIAEVLNKYFAKQSTVNDKHAGLPEFEPPNHPTLESIRITEQDVKDALSVLQCNKASGPDQVSPKLIKEGMNQLSTPLTNLFNISLRQKQFPVLRKDANVIPVY